jgi:hypothetical protein
VFESPILNVEPVLVLFKLGVDRGSFEGLSFAYWN